MRSVAAAVLLTVLVASSAHAQDPAGAIEGTITDATAAVLAGAHVVIRNLDTGFTRDTRTGPDGFYRVNAIPVGEYSVTVEVAQFAPMVQQPVTINVGQTVRVDGRLTARAAAESVTVTGRVPLVESTSNALGRVVTGRELLDLPLNGRNVTQLGLLQTGVAPLTAGVATAGGSMRSGQASAVNGMRPDENVYLVDGTQNVNRMDGGYALKLPVDAIAEFRILTQSAPPEYGATAGATTSVVTRSGTNQLRGSAYEFVRNDRFDARNYFSERVEPLRQHQFGGTVGGPLRRDRVLFFAYYEGLRNDQGITTTATVPTAAERAGDFSAMPGPLLNLAAGGVPFPGNRVPDAAINPVARNVLAMYPLPNAGTSTYRETLLGRNRVDQTGARIDVNASANDQVFGRYSYSGGYNVNPVSVRGTDVPGFPTRDDLGTHTALLSDSHIFTPTRCIHALKLCAMPSPTPASPGNTSPLGASGLTVDCTPGMNPVSRSFTSVIGLIRS
jgi:hypothetical protein